MSKKQAEFLNWLGPILDALRELDGSGKPREVSEAISSKLKLSDIVLNQTLKSGESRFHNQVAWARQYLVWEGLLEKDSRGTWILTPKGEKTNLSVEDSAKIVKKWVSIYTKARKETDKNVIVDVSIDVPADSLELNDRSDLLSTLQSLSPHGFEKICQLLLRKSGFENVIVTGKSHDGGIDGYGILEINPFVSFKVLFQCKRYKGGVSRSQVGDFRNAMIGRAEKGIMLTTGHYTSEAIKEANRDGAPSIELVDGEKLVRMFERVELGLKPKTVYEVDLNFFEQYF